MLNRGTSGAAKSAEGSREGVSKLGFRQNRYEIASRAGSLMGRGKGGRDN